MSVCSEKILVGRTLTNDYQFVEHCKLEVSDWLKTKIGDLIGLKAENRDFYTIDHTCSGERGYFMA